MATTRNPNPDHNAPLQALLDLQAAGMGTMSINDAIARLQADRRLAADMQARWQGHTYPDRAITWTRLTISPIWQVLSPEACQIALILGMYASQSTLVQCSVPSMVQITGVSRTAVKAAIRDLRAAGVIAVYRPARQRQAPIYAVNPEICKKGTSSQQGAAAYRDLLPAGTVQPVPEYAVVTATIRTADDGQYYTYTQVTAAAPGDAVPQPQAEPDPPIQQYPEFTYQEDPEIPEIPDPEPERNEGAVAGPNATTPSKLKTKHTRFDDNTIPGQMSITDYPGVVAEKD